MKIVQMHCKAFIKSSSEASKKILLLNRFLKFRYSGCFVVSFFLFVAFNIFWTSPSSADQLKKIVIIAPSTPGGAIDRFARSIAFLLRAQIHNDTRVLVHNYPGSGILSGTNAFQQKVDGKDELTLLALSPTPIHLYLHAGNNSKVRYDPAGWIPILTVPQGRVVFTRSKNENLSTMTSIRAREFAAGMIAETGSDAAVITSLRLLGVPIKAVLGYSGGNEIRLAFERGELDIASDISQAIAENTSPVKDNKINILYSFGIEVDGQIERDPYFPSVPTFLELANQLYGSAKPEIEHWWKKIIFLNIMNSKILVAKDSSSNEAIRLVMLVLSRAVVDNSFADVRRTAFGELSPTINTELSKRVFSDPGEIAALRSAISADPIRIERSGASKFP